MRSSLTVTYGNGIEPLPLIVPIRNPRWSVPSTKFTQPFSAESGAWRHRQFAAGRG